jgi:hypothetical protein
VPGLDGQLTSSRLVNASRPLAAFLLRATMSQQTSGFLPQPWWITPGIPLFLVEYKIGREITSFPMHARRVATLEEKLQKEGVELAYCRIQDGHQPVGVWFLGKQYDTSEELLRRLRIHLFRLHALRESLKHILRLIVQQQIPANQGSRGSESLQLYLNEVFRILNKESFYGIQQAALLETAYSLDHLVHEGDRATLLYQLEKIRGNILKKVSSGTKSMATASSIYQISGESISLIKGDVGGFNMSPEENIQVSGVVGPVNIKSQLDRVTQIVKNPSAMLDNKQQELVELIGELQEALKAAAEKRPEDTHRVVSTAELVATEVAKEKPDKGFLDIAVEGLKKAAQTVEDIAPAVVGVAMRIASLVAGLKI